MGTVEPANDPTRFDWKRTPSVPEVERGGDAAAAAGAATAARRDDSSFQITASLTLSLTNIFFVHRSLEDKDLCVAYPDCLSAWNSSHRLACLLIFYEAPLQIWFTSRRFLSIALENPALTGFAEAVSFCLSDTP